MSNPSRLVPMLMCGACIFGQQHSLGTAIGLVRTNDAVVIAADSRAVGGDGKKKPDTCKIRAAGSYFFTVHGVGDEDILAGISEVLRDSDILATKARRLRDKYADTIPNRMRSAPELKTSGIMMFGRESGVIQLAYVQFLVHPTTPERSHIYECPGADCPLGIAVNSASPYGDQLSTDARSLDDVREFVTSQIEKARRLEQSTGRVAFVGGPLQSLTFYSTGKHEWRDKPDVCKDER